MTGQGSECPFTFVLTLYFFLLLINIKTTVKTLRNIVMCTEARYQLLTSAMTRESSRTGACVWSYTGPSVRARCCTTTYCYKINRCADCWSLVFFVDMYGCFCSVVWITNTFQNDKWQILEMPIIEVCMYFLRLKCLFNGKRVVCSDYCVTLKSDGSNNMDNMSITSIDHSSVILIQKSSIQD